MQQRRGAAAQCPCCGARDSHGTPTLLLAPRSIALKAQKVCSARCRSLTPAQADRLLRGPRPCQGLQYRSQAQIHVPTGPLQLPAGPRLPAGPLGLPAGPLGLPAGPPGLPAGPLGLPAGPLGLPSGQRGLPAGPLGLPAGLLLAGVPGLPAGPLGLPAGPLGLPAGTLGLPAGPLGLPAGPLGLPAGLLLAGVPGLFALLAKQHQPQRVAVNPTQGGLPRAPGAAGAEALLVARSLPRSPQARDADAHWPAQNPWKPHGKPPEHLVHLVDLCGATLPETISLLAPGWAR